MIRTIRFILNHPLNQGGKVAAVGRFLRWQLATRLMPVSMAVPFVEDAVLFARRGMTGATGNWYCGLHEFDDMAFVLHVLRPDDCFLDVGANVGSYTVLAASGVGARVIAVEPVPATFSALEANIAVNRLQNRVQAWNYGLSQNQGFLRFTSGLDTINHVLAEGEQAESAIEIAVTTIDQLVAEPPRLIKIDVEGHELGVLRGAQRTLASPELLAVLMETNSSGSRYGVQDKQLFDEMCNHGFRPYSYSAIARELKAHRRGQMNTIFVRDPDYVMQRVEAARKFRLVNGWI